MKKICLLGVLICLAVGTGCQMAGLETRKPVKIFLLSGQSNMTGRGNLGDLTKPAANQQATLARYVAGL